MIYVFSIQWIGSICVRLANHVLLKVWTEMPILSL
jgi:hypothetical protein